MSKVTIMLAPTLVGAQFYFIRTTDAKVELVNEHLKDYIPACTFTTPLKGEEAADEAFDLTNNPDRQDEREDVYGRGRSVSVGDVMDVDGKKFLCLSIGWLEL